MSIILNAARLAAHYHRNQKRDSSGRPYLTHLIRVAGRVATLEGMTEENVAGAFLHDTLEDQATTPALYEEIKAAIQTQCGKEVYYIVLDLTNKSKSLTGPKLSRAERKKIDREHLATREKNVQRIKLVDRIDNVNEFAQDTLAGAETRRDFLLLYCTESEQLRNVLEHADPDLAMELSLAIGGLRQIAKAIKMP